MNITTLIKTKIARIDTGAVFTYDTLCIFQSVFSAAAKVLNRLVVSESIRRYKNGRYYKPKQTPFGELKPREDELLKSYLFENGKQVAYIAGTCNHNKKNSVIIWEGRCIPVQTENQRFSGANLIKQLCKARFA